LYFKQGENRKLVTAGVSPDAINQKNDWGGTSSTSDLTDGLKKKKSANHRADAVLGNKEPDACLKDVKDGGLISSKKNAP